ncbi:MAG: hypothetical protein ACYTFO_11645, partial [Planctomycetota bacterium]
MQIDESVRELRTGGSGMSSADYILLMPRLEQMQLEVGYRAAWAYVYHAMVMTTDTDADVRRASRLLEDATDLVQEYTVGDDLYGVQPDARYLTGLAMRLGGATDEAMNLFSQIIQSNASVDHKFNALFQGPRALAEAGRSGPALTMREQFKAEAARLLAGTTGEVDVDLRYADLGYFIHTLSAQAAQDPAQKARLAIQGQLALLSFVQAYSDNQGIQLAYYQRLAERSRGQEPEQLGSIFLIARAWDMYLKWQASDSEEGKAELQAEGLEVLEEFLSRDDDVAVALEREARELLAYWGGKGNRGQAKDFFDLGMAIHQEDPDNLEGADMVLNAVLLIQDLIVDIEAGGQPIPADLRQEFIGYMSFMLSQPQWLEGRSELGTWFFELGWNRQQVADMLNGDEAVAMRQAAIEAYESAPKTIERAEDNIRQYMEARTRALDLRVLLIRQSEAEVDATEFGRLRTMLSVYGQDCLDAAQNAAEAGQDAFRDVLMQWGSEAQFTAAEMLYDPLDRAREAVAELTELPRRWPGTDIEERCAELRIRVLV